MLKYVLFFVISYWSCIPIYTMQGPNALEHYNCSPSCTEEIQIGAGTLLCGITICGLMIADPTLIIFNNFFSCPVGSYCCYQYSRSFCCSGNQRRNDNHMVQINEPVERDRESILIQYPNTRHATHIAIKFPDNKK